MQVNNLGRRIAHIERGGHSLALQQDLQSLIHSISSKAIMLCIRGAFATYHCLASQIPEYGDNHNSQTRRPRFNILGIVYEISTDRTLRISFELSEFKLWKDSGLVFRLRVRYPSLPITRQARTLHVTDVMLLRHWKSPGFYISIRLSSIRSFDIMRSALLNHKGGAGLQ